MSTLFKGLLAFALFFAGIVAVAYALQRKLMYFPDTRRVSPKAAGLADIEERVIATPDGHKVIAWYGRARAGQPTLLYFHGNGGSLELRSERIRKHHATGRGIFMMTYRGYGGSTGSPSEAANVADGRLAHAALIAEGVVPADIIIYGESLGSGVAVQVAASRAVGGLILDAPFTSTVDVAAMIYPFLPVRWLMFDRYDSIKHLPAIRVPLLVLHGERDEVIPVAMGRRIAAAAGGPSEIVTFPEAGHSDHYLYGSYEAIGAWIDKLRAGGAPGLR